MGTCVSTYDGTGRDVRAGHSRFAARGGTASSRPRLRQRGSRQIDVRTRRVAPPEADLEVVIQCILARDECSVPGLSQHDVEAIYDALDRLRSAVVVEADRMESATRRSA
jgi:hypothetical protein